MKGGVKMKSKKLSYNKILVLFSIVVVLVLMTGCNGQPIVSIFSADPSTINQGESSTLTWSVSDADTVTITPDVGTVASSASTSVSPAVTTNYILTATNSAGSVNATVTVTVEEGFAVTSVTASVDPSSFIGACPKTFNFYAVITVNGPGTVTYRWERSDGASGTTKSITFAAAGSQTVTDSWTIGISYSGWQVVHILTPNDSLSNQANFTLTCEEGFAVTSVTASVFQSSFIGGCPKTFHFSAVITVNGPGTVTYRWERSDGGSADTQSITFAAAGSQTVTDSWRLWASYSGWERVHILTPNDSLSNQANFTLTCEEEFAVTSVTASVTPESFTGACSKTFNFSAVITVNGPGTVKYRWERSDGASGPPQSITFTAAGSKTVTTSWTLTASYSGWQVVHISTPNDTFSNYAKFKFTLEEEFAVTSVTASVDPSSFTGACHKTFNFSAVIKVNCPGTVIYRWERSDGGSAPIQSITFTAAGSKTVTTSWSLGASYSGWRRVHILTPNDTFSNYANFTLTCICAVTSVTASVNPPVFNGSCPKKFNFSAVITVNGPGTVTYRWERSYWTSGDIKSITFAAAGSKTVTTSWTFGFWGFLYTGWQRVHILTPNDKLSNKAWFLINCYLP
jgi:hypothetical protein